MKIIALFLTVFLSLILAGCTGQNGTPTMNSKAPDRKLKIGFSMDTLKEERWQKDRDHFVKRAEELGAEVIVQSADGNDETQINQAQALLLQGIDVLVVIPHNADVAGAIVDAAKKDNVPVISYDRLIRNSAPDLYISFDNEKVGEQQAKYVLDRAPKGNYILIGGAPTDNNAKMFRAGQMKVLQPAIDRRYKDRRGSMG